MQDDNSWSCAGFDPGSYADAHPDTSAGPLLHFLSYGARERRQFPIELNPTAFDASDPIEVIAALSDCYFNGFGDQLDLALPAIWAKVDKLIELGAKPIIVIGDSHTGLYRRTPLCYDGWVLPLVCLFSAGSARGLSNPNGRTQYRQRIEGLLGWLATLPKTVAPPVIFKFGQVDVEFVSVFKRIERREKHFDEEAFADFSRETVDRYLAFLMSVAPASSYVATIFPPTLSDASWRDGYANAHVVDIENPGTLDSVRQSVRGLTVPNLSERTSHHALFNQLLACGVEQTTLSFWNDFNAALGTDGTVDPQWVGSAGGNDHHLDFFATRPLFENLLTSMQRQLANRREA
ncbi:hypothetical protein FHS31_002688 [Sphingomonas vulcanisoli]|uniref:SGNH/GDSL hydrolase family protein n=1 Tax=Sphingomonas vulcanisoli TaxID=1658060 RepID=A0ABX0TU63_9SPHN|nr:hypothetical protein [Sphingomonas vulcanisoli]NIJ09058.1 hypothetical protein [Sphingomonas vulcanisoli]